MSLLGIYGYWPDALNTRLREKNLSTTDLAFVCEVDKSTIRRWRAKKKIAWAHIAPIMAVTGLPINLFMNNEFLNGKNDPWVAINHPEDPEKPDTIKNCDLPTDVLASSSPKQSSKVRHDKTSDEKPKASSLGFKYDDTNRPYAETSSRAAFAFKDNLLLPSDIVDPVFDGGSAVIAKAIMVELEEIQASRIRNSLPDLNVGPARTCQFITSPEGEHSHISFCGKASIPGKSYCLEHAKRCFIKPSLIRV